MRPKRIRNLEKRGEFITEQLIKALNPCQSCRLIEIKEDLASILFQAQNHRHPFESEGLFLLVPKKNNEFLKLLFQNVDILAIT